MKKGISREGLLLVVVVLFWFALYLHIPYQTPFLTGAGVAAGFTGTIVGAYGITQLFFRLPLGVLADYAGKHKIFVVLGAGLAGLACAVRILVPTGPGFLAANLISGCAASMWIAYMVLYSNYFSKKEQQKATSKVIMACNLGMCLAFVFSSCFYGKMGMSFLCGAGVLAGIAGVIGGLFVKEDLIPVNGKAGERPGIGTYLSVCGNKRLILFALLALIQQGIQMATAMSFTTQILENLGASALFIGCASIFYMIAAVASAQFASTDLCERKGPAFYVPLVFFLTAIYCILVPASGHIYVIFVLQALPGMSTGILLSYLTSESMKEVPREKSSTAMGFFQAVYAVGMTLFPWAVGVLTENFDIKMGYNFLASAAFVGTVVSMIYYRKANEKKSFT